MKLLCAWCLKEGKPPAEALMGEKAPLQDVTETHGICPEHRLAIEAELEALQKASEVLRRNVDP